MREDLVDAIAGVAAEWQRYSIRRTKAVEATLTAPNTFTRRQLQVAIDHWMSELTSDRLPRWVRSVEVSASNLRVGVLNAGNVPFVGLQDFLAILVSGFPYAGVLSSKSPYLLPAFAADLQERVPTLNIRFGELNPVLLDVDALVVTGSDVTTKLVADRAARSGIQRDHLQLRDNKHGIAVLQAGATGVELERLAEDCLLYEGRGCLNVATVFGPEDLMRPFSAALEAFRTRFPAHERTRKQLEHEFRLLSAVGLDVMRGEGWLLTRNEPGPRKPCSIVWSELDDRWDMDAYVRAELGSLQVLVGPDELRNQFRDIVYCVPYGKAQRPAIGWPQDGVSILEFLRRLGQAQSGN